MKKITAFLCGMTVCMGYAQQNIDDLLSAGVSDAQRFATDYFTPASDGLMYSMNHGWFNNAKVKDKFGFEISVVANVAFVGDDQKSFILDPNEYENLDFRDNPGVARPVATAFGDIEGVTVVVRGESGIPAIPAQDAEFELPTGLGDANINFVPTAFLQASLRVMKGTEIKARFLPTIQTDDVEVGFYGLGVQHEFTSWLPARKLFPVAISGLIAYTHLDGSYDFSSTSIVQGENQLFENNTNTWLFQVIGSTKLPIFNVYGGIGYLSGTSTNSLKGTYRVQSGVITSPTLEDPFSIETKVAGLRGTLGAKLTLAFFRLHVDYTLAAYNGVSVGLNFGF